MDFPKFPELFRVARDTALIHQRNLTVEAAEREGSELQILLAASAGVGEELGYHLARLSAALFVETARREALDRLVFDRVNLLRSPASPGRTTLSFTTTAPAPSAFALPAGTVVAGVGLAAGVQYTIDEDVTFPVGSTGPVLAAATSTGAGANQQVQANVLTNLVTSLPLAPTDLAVTNPLASSGAADEEKDEELRTRYRGFYATQEKGTLAALRLAALAVPGVRTASAFTLVDGSARALPLGQIVVSDAFTEALANLTTTPPSYATQSQLLAASVAAALETVQAYGAHYQVIVASVVITPVTLSLAFAAGVNTLVVARKARAEIANYINTLNPGATLTTAALYAILRRIPGLVVSGSEIVVPAGNVVPQLTQVLRVPISLVTTTNAETGAQVGSVNPDAATILG